MIYMIAYLKKCIQNHLMSKHSSSKFGIKKCANKIKNSAFFQPVHSGRYDRGSKMNL